jgi:hypothetical protein
MSDMDDFATLIGLAVGEFLLTVRDVSAGSKGQFEELCDPSDPFRGVGDK